MDIKTLKGHILASLLKGNLVDADLDALLAVARHVKESGLDITVHLPEMPVLHVEVPSASYNARDLARRLIGHSRSSENEITTLAVKIDVFLQKFSHGVTNDKKITAIKSFREITGLGLADSKNAIEHIYGV